MLSVRSLDVFYGEAQALGQVMFDLAAGEACALLGRNGVGKSTLLKALAGQEVQRSGQIIFTGQDVTAWPAWRIARAGIAWVPDSRRLFSDMTVADNLALAASLAGNEENTQKAKALALFPALADRLAQPAGSLSGGEQQMLAIARALMMKPRLLLLDEPSEGLAPKLLDHLAEALLSLRANGLAILMAEQNPAFAARLCPRALALDRGRVAYDGSMVDLLADPARRRDLLAL